MDKTEKLKVENQIKELEEKLSELKSTVESIDEEEGGEWIPKEGQMYYYIDNRGEIRYLIWTDNVVDHNLLNLVTFLKPKKKLKKKQP